MIVVGKNGSKNTRYTITKSNHFDAKGFKKAIDKAKWPTHLSYSEGANWWLKRNAKKFGYKYESKNVKKGD